MTAQPSLFHPRQREFSAGLPNMSSTAPWTHEADFETHQQPRPGYPPPPNTFSLPFDNPQRRNELESCSDGRIGSDDNHAPYYHYGKMWESDSLQERYDTSPWTTSSSSEWIVNHVHHDSAELQQQYWPPSPPHVRILNQPAISGISPNGAPFVPDNQVFTVLRSGVPPSLVPPDNMQIFFAPPTFPRPRTPLATPRSPKPPAHQPIAPEQQSSYSELAANLKFMEKLREEELSRPNKVSQTRPLTITIPKPSATTKAANTVVDSIRITPSLTSRPSAAKKRKRSKHVPPHFEGPGASDESSAASTGRGSSPSDTISNSATAEVTASATRRSSSGTKNYKEPRKPSLACTFCRERKISCGRPPPGSPDPTCNQCARRSFNCTYVHEHSRKYLASRKR